MIVLKKLSVLVAVLAAIFGLSFLYAWLSMLADFFEFGGVVSCAVVVPFLYILAVVGLAGPCLMDGGFNQEAELGISGAICGVAAAWCAAMAFARVKLGVWLLSPGDLVDAMDILTDMREVKVLFIPVTGSFLMFCYWIEAILTVAFGTFAGVVCLASEDADKKQTVAGEARTPSKIAKMASMTALCLAIGCLLAGCSGDEGKKVVPPDEQALKTWVNAQDFSTSPKGGSAKTIELKTRSGRQKVAVGIGAAVIPRNPKLLAANEKRTRYLAIKALMDEAGIEDAEGVEGVVPVKDEDIATADRPIHVSVLACVVESEDEQTTAAETCSLCVSRIGQGKVTGFECGATGSVKDSGDVIHNILKAKNWRVGYDAKRKLAIMMSTAADDRKCSYDRLRMMAFADGLAEICSFAQSACTAEANENSGRKEEANENSGRKEEANENSGRKVEMVCNKVMGPVCVKVRTVLISKDEEENFEENFEKRILISVNNQEVVDYALAKGVSLKIAKGASVDRLIKTLCEAGFETKILAEAVSIDGLAMNPQEAEKLVAETASGEILPKLLSLTSKERNLSLIVALKKPCGERGTSPESPQRPEALNR